MDLIARVKRTAGAAGISLVILAGVMAATPGHTYAATPVAVGGTALVTNTDGDSIRVRTGAGTEFDRVGTVEEGDVLSVIDGPAQDSSGINWFKIRTSGVSGWVMSEFLTGKDAPEGSRGSTPVAAPAGAKLEGFATVANAGGDPVRLRTEASRNGSVVAKFDEGTSVAIKDGPKVDSEGISWYQVSANGLTGWMMAQYLVQADAPAAAPPAETVSQPAAPQAPAAPATPPAQEVTSAPAESSSLGQRAVGVAMQYVGYRYVYGGMSPSGFDCSGFVYYVYHKTLGIPVTRDMYTQTNSGTRISKANLQPGDMVFFQNTYKAGLSHAGIYIGNGRFIHAENESTGVVISSLNNAYWSAHWWGATRPSR
ncbi:MAG: NlpC/P60 family protein [Chloroflexia bacterium]